MINYTLKVLKERINKYKYQYIFGILIALSLEVFIRYSAFDYDIKKESSYSDFRKYIYKIMNDCSIKTKNKNLQNFSYFVKGQKYVIQNSNDENEVFRSECITTTWNVFHFFSHFILVFIFPYFYREIFAISFLYEIYEYFAFKCHDLSDVIYNIMGLFLGYQLRKIYDK
jgi:hypothetical protein